MESDLQHSSDDTWVDAQGRQTKKEAAFSSRRKHALSENDIAVMKGIAQSGALSVQREIGGLYSPHSSFRPCGDLPTTPTAYLDAQGLYKCGLSDLIIGEKSEVAATTDPQSGPTASARMAHTSRLCRPEHHTHAAKRHGLFCWTTFGTRFRGGRRPTDCDAQRVVEAPHEVR